ncbi:Uncharacterised protein [Vibrio cholerae]|nr:Uncharacterised protein [Vibrio cholerae]CSI76002.1 Uncharacterised protein [Vibrio cholerae]
MPLRLSLQGHYLPTVDPFVGQCRSLLSVLRFQILLQT